MSAPLLSAKGQNGLLIAADGGDERGFAVTLFCGLRVTQAQAAAVDFC